MLKLENEKLDQDHYFCQLELRRTCPAEYGGTRIERGVGRMKEKEGKLREKEQGLRIGGVKTLDNGGLH